MKDVILHKKNRIIIVFYYLLYIYLTCNIFTKTAEGGGGLLNQTIAGVFIIYCSFIIFFSKNRINHRGRKIYQLLFWFVVFIVSRLLIMYIIEPRLAIESIRSCVTLIFWIVGILFCLKVFNYSRLEDHYEYSIVLIILVFISFFYSIFLERTYYNSIEKIGAVNAAASAYMLVPLILLVLKGKMRYAGYILCLIVCSLSGKRQALLGFSTISLFLIIDLVKGYFKSFRYLGIIFLFCVVTFSSAVINVVFSGIIERQQYKNETGELDSGRAILWKWSMDGFRESPDYVKVLGGGPGTGSRYIEQRLGCYLAPHNAYIQILCDYGIIGLLLYSLFFLSIFDLSLKFPRGSLERKLLFGIFLTCVISSLFSHAGRIWILFMGMAICIMLHDEYKKTKWTL